MPTHLSPDPAIPMLRLFSPLVRCLQPLLCLLVAGTAAGQTPIPPPPGLIHWWPGDGSAEDIVGGRHGALSGDATCAPGLVGQAFGFDGR